ncbi:hypothetical protein GL263_09805 [Streptomyces durbertensis]|uniref:Uncharacterized protein n=1 Tax=Streptomyces durbertensis TaxID=2448886 RepID=A0ABR6EEV7_9ACTN|nr:hypothetical protein [Streptomyces durbertensis]MBB1243850.1 hypothetical protein [Streptomyces durbertensis]
MVSVSERRALRGRVLREVYERANGTSSLVEAHRVREALGVDDRDMGAACEYLVGEGLLSSQADTFGAEATPSLIGLTHRGVVHVEEAAEG